ncbi:MAG TPA: AAA family ATPase [Gemmataceae bacterium]|nr:AAA family ATPase [Gemmataceae bacterium]
MKLPTWDELQGDSQQLDVLEHPLDQALFVAGPPGSGKTVLAVRRAEMLAESGTQATIITFNRMLRRLVSLLSNGTNAARTMHSFVWRDYLRRTGQRKPPTSGQSSFDYTWDEMLDAANSSSHPKEEHLIIDEGQDLAEGFFRYASSHAASVLTVFADDDQALDDRHSTLEQIMAAANLPKPRMLKSNHRNAPEVARVAEHFHAGGRLPAADVRRIAIGTLPRLIRSKGIDTTADTIATWFRNRGGSVGVIVHSNAVGATVQKLLKVRLPSIRIDRYCHGSGIEDSINVNEDGVTILNRESVKGQEFDSVFVLEIDQMLPWRTQTMRRVLYMICARARDYLILVYGPTPLSTLAERQLPGPKILERV